MFYDDARKRKCEENMPTQIRYIKLSPARELEFDDFLVLKHDSSKSSLNAKVTLGFAKSCQDAPRCAKMSQDEPR